jgi:kynurenine formamidase
MGSKMVFLSHSLSNETIGYGGQRLFHAKTVQSISEGQSCNRSEWQLSNHIGTHIDAPFHFSKNGATLDQYEAAFWIFNNPQLCVIPTDASVIIDVGEWCDRIAMDADLLLLKTGFEKHRNSETYWAHNPGLAPALGAWLRKFRPQIRVVGMDFISLTSYDHRSLGRVAHHSFLHEENPGRPVLIVEDMHLADLTVSPRKVVIAPILVKSSDGAPVTVIAEVDENV